MNQEDRMCRSDFIDFLNKEYGLVIAKSKLEFIENKLLLAPLRLDNNYRQYSEADAVTVLKISIMNQ
ncbi:hypothetical protein AMQ83_31330 [Paenibacillus riograndensis]|nr:hypothetical protein AMQ83_31330 [Paenibacillus riograndensis]